MGRLAGNAQLLRLWIVFTAITLFFPCLQSNAAGKGNSPNGVPFTTLNAQISELQAKTAALQDQIASLVAKVESIEDRISANEAAIALLQQQNSDLRSLSALGSDLQAQINYNNNMIQRLQEDTLNIQRLLSMKQMIVSGTCPIGQAIRQVNGDGSVVCGISGGASGIDQIVVYQFNYAYPQTSNYVEASCPPGYAMSGGGFDAYGQNVSSSHGNTVPWNNTWTVEARNPDTASSYLYVYANCMKLIP